MAAAAYSAAHSLNMLTLSYTNHALGTEHNIALLKTPLLSNRVNFLALPPRGWTDWHGAWAWELRTSQLSVNLHRAAGELPLRNVTASSDAATGRTRQH